MSRQLSRIRSMVAEIEEIQKTGQAEGKAHQENRRYARGEYPAPQPVAQTVEKAPEPVTPFVEKQVDQWVAQSFEQPKPVAAVSSINPAAAAVAEPAKIAIQLTGQVTVALQIENTDEIVEIRQIENAIEIRFADGKAVHLPLKNVA